MKLCVVLSLLAVAAAHHIPGHVGGADPVLLAVQGVPVRVLGDGEGFLVRDWDSGLGTNVHGGLLYAPELPVSENLLTHVRRRRQTGFSYTAPDGTSRTERVEMYIDPRVRDRHPLTRVTGRVSYTSPEGVPVVVKYIADGSGYHVLP